MRYTIRKKGEKYYKKFKPCGAKMIVIAYLLFTWGYILFEVIRG
jgi:hypothetical protein